MDGRCNGSVTGRDSQSDKDEDVGAVELSGKAPFSANYARLYNTELVNFLMGCQNPRLASGVVTSSMSEVEGVKGEEGRKGLIAKMDGTTEETSVNTKLQRSKRRRKRIDSEEPSKRLRDEPGSSRKPRENGHISITRSVPADSGNDSSDSSDVDASEESGQDMEVAMEDDVDEEILMTETPHIGVWWSSEEKERFFEFLGRKSRHRLDEVAVAIGTKSLAECETYFELLRAASQEHVPLPIEEIPFAREMSDDWIYMEEEQSGVIDDFELKSIEVVKHGAQKRQGKNREQFANSILNFDAIFDTSNVLQWHDVPRNISVTGLEHLSVDFLQETERLVRQFVKSMMRESASVVRKRRIPNVNDALSVRRGDVFVAARILGVDPTRRSYWQKFVQKLEASAHETEVEREEQGDEEEGNRVLVTEGLGYELDDNNVFGDVPDKLYIIPEEVEQSDGELEEAGESTEEGEESDDSDDDDLNAKDVEVSKDEEEVLRGFMSSSRDMPLSAVLEDKATSNTP